MRNAKLSYWCNLQVDIFLLTAIQKVQNFEIIITKQKYKYNQWQFLKPGCISLHLMNIHYNFLLLAYMFSYLHYNNLVIGSCSS